MRNIHRPPVVTVKGFAELSAEDKIRFLLSYAVLAPSTHNTQPWKFRINKSICEIFIDESRQLPAADPLKRDMYISMGAMLKNLEIAAKAYGFFERIKLSNQSTNLVAEAVFKKLDQSPSKVSADCLAYLEAIRTRTNYRGPFKSENLPEIAEKNIKSAGEGVGIHVIKNRSAIKDIAKITADGLQSAYSRPEFRKEISAWIKPNSSTKKKGIPGYSLRMPMLTSHIVPRIIRFKDIGPKLAMLNYKSFITAPAVVILASRKEDPRTWLKIGQTAQEIFLKMEQSGLVCSIFVAAVETSSLQPKLKKLAGIKNDAKPQFLFCVGQPVLPKVYSPRESVKSKMLI